MSMMSSVAREVVWLHVALLIVRMVASFLEEWDQTVLRGFACVSTCPPRSSPGYQGSLAGLFPRQQLSSVARVLARKSGQLLQRLLCLPIFDCQSLSVFRVAIVLELRLRMSACR